MYDIVYIFTLNQLARQLVIKLPRILLSESYVPTIALIVYNTNKF